MNYDEKQEESRRAHNSWLDQQRYRRQDEEWRQKRLDEDLREANRYAQQGDMYLSILRRAGPAAAEAYAQSTREFQENSATMARTYYDRARAAFAAGNYDVALTDFNNCFIYAPNSPELYAFRGLCYEHLHRYKEAEWDYSKDIQLNPKSGIRYMRRGTCRVQLREFDAAINDLNIAENLLPNEGWNANTEPTLTELYADLRYDRGCARYHRGDFYAARDDFGACIQAFPNWDDPYIWRAIVLRKLQYPAGAIQDLTVVLNRNPTAATFRIRSAAYSSVDNHIAAVADMDKVIQIDPTPEDYASRGWGYLILGGFDDKALSDFETAIALGDHSAHAYGGRGCAQSNKGNITEALEDFNTAIRLDPEHWSAYRRRGRIRYDLGEYEVALADFNEDVRINPTEPRSYMARGDCQLKLGNRIAATKDFLRAADLFREQNMPEKAVEAMARAF